MRLASGPFIVGIMGASCSGKTTICERLEKLLPVTVVQMDWYYRDPSTFRTKHGYPNGEEPSCIDFGLLAAHLRLLHAGEEVTFTTVRKKEHVRILPAPLIAVEGFLLFCDPAIRDLLDLRVFVDIPEEEAIRRKIARARSALARDENYVRLLTIGEYRLHGLPMRTHAQLTLDGTRDADENARLLANAIAERQAGSR